MKIRGVLAFVLFLSFISCKSNYYTEENFSKVLKIDAHVHLRPGKSNLSEQALKDNFKLITLNVDIGQASMDTMVKEIYPDGVFYAATFHFDTAGWDSEDWSKKVILELTKHISGGAVSVKFWKNIGMNVRDRNGKFIMVDDQKLDPVIDFIIKQNLPITGHLGEPHDCWLPLNNMTVKSDSEYYALNPQYHMFLHPEYPDYNEQIKARDHMLEKHPQLKFVGAHLGSLEWSVDELAKRLDKFPNMAVDMAERVQHLQYQSLNDHNKIREFCIKYQDRLIYGTDIIDRGRNNSDTVRRIVHKRWLDDWKYFVTGEEVTSDQFKGRFRGLHLPCRVIEKIYNKNAISWYKLKI
jgi:hypothetical protein